ncbi:MAG TPA: ABC transporter permease, partial [Gemmataceae bacterium]|nr:ABC transporter permease [Gemmataceae bacterium]
MLRAIFWKEWRQQRVLVLAILILMPIVLGVFVWASGLFGALGNVPLSDKLGMFSVWVAFLQAIVTGSMLFAGESESGTLDYLDACSADRSRIWFAKMTSALGISLPIALVPTLFVGLEGLLLTAFVLETLVFAATASVFVRTTFRAIGATIVSLGLIFYAEGPILAAIERLRLDHRTAYVAIIGLNLANVGVALYLSWRRFCRTDRERLADKLGSVVVRVPPGWLTGPMWMVLRRQWMSLLAVGLGLVAFYFWIEQATDQYGRYGRMDALAPALLLAIGCVCGWSVYALEPGGTELFLGDQRFPRGRLWLAKAGVWLALTILPVLPIAVASFQRGGYFPPDASWLDRWGITHALPMLMLGMLGFSVGHLFGIHDRRLPVTIVLTVLVAMPIGAAWYAPLYGGASAWQLVVVPILILAAGRFELRRWTAGRLDGAAHWIRCGVIVLVCFAWTGLILWQRTVEVPDVGEPFVAVESTTETPMEHERNQRIASLATTARYRFDQVRGIGYLDENRKELARKLNDEFGGDWPIDQVRGPDDPDDKRKEFARKLNDAFAGDWATSLRNEVIDEPRRLPIGGGRDPNPDSLDDAARLLRLKSSQLLAEGKTKAALDEFATALAIVRHCVRFGGYPGSISAFHAVRIEHEMLDAAESMLQRGGSDPALCRGLLDLLNRHSQEMPSFSDLIKASYSVTAERSS